MNVTLQDLQITSRNMVNVKLKIVLLDDQWIHTGTDKAKCSPMAQESRTPGRERIQWLSYSTGDASALGLKYIYTSWALVGTKPLVHLNRSFCFTQNEVRLQRQFFQSNFRIAFKKTQPQINASSWFIKPASVLSDEG